MTYDNMAYSLQKWRTQIFAMCHWHRQDSSQNFRWLNQLAFNHPTMRAIIWEIVQIKCKKTELILDYFTESHRLHIQII